MLDRRAPIVHLLPKQESERVPSILDLEHLDQETKDEDGHSDPNVDGESLPVRTEHFGCEGRQRDRGECQ
jgi:hypothetical protein